MIREDKFDGCFKLEISLLPKMTNRKNIHWRLVHKERNEVKAVVRLALSSLYPSDKPKKPVEHARLWLARHSSVCPDPDGLVSGFKSVIDALVEYGILKNDRYTNIGMPEYRWFKAPAKQGKISVTVGWWDA